MNFSYEEALECLEKYGSPIYIYDEMLLRKRCSEIKKLVKKHPFIIHYSIKANSNPYLLKIIQSEGILVDAVSCGEIALLKKVGFEKEVIFYVSNNMSPHEMRYAITEGILMSVDSLSQLKQYGQLNPSGKICLRLNCGVGTGHNEKVITGGIKTKFGILTSEIEEALLLIDQYHLHCVGLNQHIGSLFLESELYLEGMRTLMEQAHHFHELEFLDFGGGFGVPYQAFEGRLDLEDLATKMEDLLDQFAPTYPNPLTYKIEPGRYLVAECGQILGTVHSVKQNGKITYVGTDIGFNVLMRPVLYNSYHDVQLIQRFPNPKTQLVTVTGNICESGDLLAADRILPYASIQDLIVVKNAGAYGYSMSSNYNCRLKPAEILIKESKELCCIRRKETYEDLFTTWV